jgi:hypothetical protein
MFVTLALASFALQQSAPPQAQAPSPVARITVEPAEPWLVVGDSVRLRAQALDSTGRPVSDARLRFFGGGFEGSVNDSTGVVRGGSRGVLRVYVLAFVPDRAASKPTIVNVTINPPPAARVVVRPAVSRLAVGQRLTLGADVFAANGDQRDDRARWTSSAATVARVGADGQLEAVAPGRATITAAAGGAQGGLTVEVVANTVRRLEITGGAAEARTGDVLRFRAAAKDVNGRDVAGLTPVWTMAPGNGLIDQDGAFVANDPGDYTVTATLGAVTTERVVRVRSRDARRKTHTVGRVAVKGLLTAEFWPHPDGKHAYLSTVGDRVYALDITNPASPRITDSVVVDARHINDVMSTADGKWAVITRENASSRRNGIVILDLADPAHPKVASEYTETVTGGVHSAFVYTQPRHGTHVYLTDDATGSLRVIDINDPKAPKEIARWQPRREQTGNTLHDLDIRDGLAYLAYWNDGLIILDVGNGMRGGSPATPQLVSQLKYDLDALYRTVEAEGGPGFIRGTHTAWRHKNYVFIGDEVFTATPQGLVVPGLGLGRANGRLHVVDVSDITKPKIVAWYEPRDGGMHNVWVAGDTLYAGDYQGGLRVVDISGELRGDLLQQGREMAWVHTGDANGHVANASMAWGAFYHNGLVWVNDMFSGLWVVKVEPKEPAGPVVP